ncbi:type II toxin-antitoxin system VapC family toxin [Methanobacterium sp.]|uniref:type II toxin-antitoxin system VapC family toxin n=1 Tax=Methanobacterium sp. TaxID=2164 RepID=UPI0009DED829|nr:type II toxin-antitoxin system VapC family toxin [Methanobacterium sp.]
MAAIFLQEPSSDKATQAEKNHELVTVDLPMTEVANVAWKRVTLFNEDQVIINKTLQMCMEFIETSCTVISTRELVEESFQIALKNRISFYDALFVGLALREEIPLLTRDKRLGKISELVKVL